MSQPHDEWFHKLAALRVEMLSETERMAFEEHIQSCVPCREQLHQYQVVDESLRRYFSLPVLDAEPPSLPISLKLRTVNHQSPVHNVPRWHRPQQKQSFLALGMRFVSIPLAAGLVVLSLMHVPGINSSVVVSLTFFAFAAIILGSAIRSRPMVREEWNNASSPQHYLASSTTEALLFPPSTAPDRSEAQVLEGWSEDQALPQPFMPHPATEKSWRDRGRWLIISLTLLVVGVVYLSSSLFSAASSVSSSTLNQRQNSSSSTLNAAPQLPLMPIGISVNGDRVFDIGSDRKDVEFKQAAAQYVHEGNMALAAQEWRQAVAVESDDAEALIYLENKQVTDNIQASPARFTSRMLVVFTTLAQEHIGGGRDILQGAYVAQEEYNAQVRQAGGGVLLRLMIAVTNKDSASIVTVTRQIVDAAQHDPSILGVMGLPTSNISTIAYPLLAQAHLPMVSPTSSSESLSGISRYFFRIAPQDAFQGRAGANYARTVLHAKNVALFVSDSDPYSQSLANAFADSFSDLDHHIARFSFQPGQPETIEAAFKKAEQLPTRPDLIYFAGFVNDASVVLKLLPNCTATDVSCLKVMGGDALYVQGDYTLEAYKNYSRLIFTAFAFSDAWQAQGLTQEPAFFKKYTQAFDPAGQYQAGKYGFNRADADTILSYDAMQALLHALKQLVAGPGNLTPETMDQALQQIDAHHAFQGVSRKIAFGADGNPIDSQVVVLVGGSDNQTTLAAIEPGTDH